MKYPVRHAGVSLEHYCSGAEPGCWGSRAAGALGSRGIGQHNIGQQGCHIAASWAAGVEHLLQVCRHNIIRLHVAAWPMAGAPWLHGACNIMHAWPVAWSSIQAGWQLMCPAHLACMQEHAVEAVSKANMAMALQGDPCSQCRHGCLWCCHRCAVGRNKHCRPTALGMALVQSLLLTASPMPRQPQWAHVPFIAPQQEVAGEEVIAVHIAVVLTASWLWLLAPFTFF